MFEKFYFFTSIILCLFNPSGICAQSLTEISDFGNNDGDLRMYLHETIKKNEVPRPLVVVLHGCSQSAENVAKQSGWNALADKYDFLVIYPEQKYSNNVSHCFNWFYEKDLDPERGESSSILEMIDYTRRNYAIDSNQIFIYGLSAGAAMSVNLLGNRPTLFNSGASLAGGPYGMATNFVQAARAMLNPKTKTAKEWASLVPKSKNQIYPKLIIVHGTIDNSVDFANAIELIKQWTYLHQIEYKNRISVGDFMGNTAVQRFEYPENENDSDVIFYKIKDLGHALPVDPGTQENQGGETGIFAVDCDFFSTYYIAKDFGLIKE